MELDPLLVEKDNELKKLLLEYKNIICPFLSSDFQKKGEIANSNKSIINHNDSSIMKFLIYKKINREFIGFCGIVINSENSSGKIFYILSSRYKGNGFAIESIKMLIKIAFTELNLNNVKAEIPFNLRGAWKPVERAGMSYLGDFMVKDHEKRFLLFKINKKEYLNQVFY